jgi:hypothetical protein
MKNMQWWSKVIAILTRGATPIDGVVIPGGNDTDVKPAETRVRQRREALTSETEFDAAIYPKWGNFR